MPACDKVPTVALLALANALGSADDDATRYQEMKAETIGRHAEERSRRQNIQRLCVRIGDDKILFTEYSVKSLAREIHDLCIA